MMKIIIDMICVNYSRVNSISDISEWKVIVEGLTGGSGYQVGDTFFNAKEVLLFVYASDGGTFLSKTLTPIELNLIKNYTGTQLEMAVNGMIQQSFSSGWYLYSENVQYNGTNKKIRLAQVWVGTGYSVSDVTSSFRFSIYYR